MQCTNGQRNVKKISDDQTEHLNHLLDGIYDLMHKKAEFYAPVNHKDPKIKCPLCGMNKNSPILSLCDNEFCPYN